MDIKQVRLVVLQEGLYPQDYRQLKDPSVVRRSQLKVLYAFFYGLVYRVFAPIIPIPQQSREVSPHLVSTNLSTGNRPIPKEYPPDKSSSHN